MKLLYGLILAVSVLVLAAGHSVESGCQDFDFDLNDSNNKCCKKCKPGEFGIIWLIIYTLVNIWSGSKPFIKVVLKPKCIRTTLMNFLIHFKCWLLYINVCMASNINMLLNYRSWLDLWLVKVNSLIITFCLCFCSMCKIPIGIFDTNFVKKKKSKSYWNIFFPF